ncbi:MULTISPECIES: helix-hairpin-helix domain-containing protein [Paraburkholderia]|uniref:Uncharacterized protein n=1 Tax=Paraburkholderia dioscoreae TaxID=2604047 RepID=A0A5Q4Z1S8_9BURK|nr:MULTISPECIES: helix-hairpin-helix domain-containing protein [Paraburkholderia]MDR8397038.1 hypothetical protein [Paraburkholderia sp. USG1]VVD27592.1 protein of unknown function [Paraburkholderia dioscoreae]
MTELKNCRGNIVRLLSHGAFGGAISALELSQFIGTKRTGVVVVVADAPLFLERPIIGESWNIKGHWFESPVYGRQFKAIEATRCKPSGLGLVHFLGKTGLFGALTVRDARNLRRGHGTSLVEALDLGDVEMLRVHGIRREKCKALVEGWSRYWSLAQINDLLAPYWIHPRVATKLHNLFGVSAYGLILDNPYRLAPFLKWNDLERLASTLSTKTPPEVRLIAACNHLLLDMQRRGRVSVPYSYVIDRLSVRLGSKSAATAAIKKAVAAKVAYVAIERGTRHLHSAGVEIIQRALCASLVTTRALVAVPEKQAQSVEIISAPSLTIDSAILILAQSHRCVVHILGVADSETTSLIARLAHVAAAASDVLRDAEPHLSCEGADVIVHDADQLSFVTLNKLLHRLRNASRIRMLGRAHGYPAQTDGLSVFADLGVSNVLSLESLASFAKPDIIVGKPDFKHIGVQASTFVPRVRPTSIYWLETPPAREASATAAAFRECAHFGSAVLFTTHAAEAIRWNMQFHNETAELRAMQGERTHVVKIQNLQSASDGDPIVMLRSDLERGLIAGTRGVLSTSDNASYFHPSHGDIAYETIDVGNVGTVTVTPEHLSNCALSYAVPLRAPFLGCVDYAVIALASDHDRTQAQLLMSRAISHARRGVLVVSEQRPEFEFDKEFREPPPGASIAGFRSMLIAASVARSTSE